MEDVSYVCSVYPRFNGLYYAVEWEDFKTRGDNLPSLHLPNVKQLLTHQLQRLIEEYEREKKPLPEPNFAKYSYFESSYGDECQYFCITAKCRKVDTRTKIRMYLDLHIQHLTEAEHSAEQTFNSIQRLNQTMRRQMRSLTNLVETCAREIRKMD